MSVLRQGAVEETGRVNQKRRTRAAIVDAAKELVQSGVAPTVAQAAEKALVSRTTAYRYFPTQDALLLELAVHLDVDDIEAVLREPIGDGERHGERALAVIDTFNRHVLADETRYRTALRLYLDMWLAAVADGDESPTVREGRRRRWLGDSLGPLRGELDDAAFDRLVAALSLVMGIEPIVVLSDVCQLDADGALAVTTWASAALLDAALAEATTGSSRTGSSRTS
jgi:AcrR family transcriptional regulator